jgi:hypothetical protein
MGLAKCIKPPLAASRWYKKKLKGKMTKVKGSPKVVET